MIKTTNNRSEEFVLSVTVDFPDDVIYGPFSLKLIDELMCEIRYMGASRVYWLYYGDVEQDSYWAGNIFQNSLFGYGNQTITDIGEPLKAAVPIAHRHGLEIYGVIKPYNLGASGSYSEGSNLFDPTGIQRIGGNVWQVIPFLKKYPHTRMERQAIDTSNPIDNINIDKIKLLKKDDSPTRIKSENIQIWVSNNNYQYKKIDIKPSYKESTELSAKKTIDYYGQTITEVGQAILTITLQDLNISDKYVVVTTDFQDETGDFVNTGVDMAQVFNNSQIIPTEIATLSTVWHGPRDFRTGGLEFDSGFGTLLGALDSSNSPPKSINNWNIHQRGGIIAIAKGKNDYLPSTPCEMYPEVQKLWDGWVDKVLATGVDGIDIRISSHGSLVDAPNEYGFDPPTIEKFLSEYGYKPTNSQNDKDRIAEIRGRTYTNFIRNSSRKTRSLGKKFQFHMHTEAFRKNPVHGQILGFPPNIIFEWETWLNEKLIDGATFRTSWFEGWEDPPDQTAKRQDLNKSLTDPVALKALFKLNENKIPLYLNRYIGRSIGLKEYLQNYELTFNDDRFSGFDVYEFYDLAHAKENGLGFKKLKRQIFEIRKKSIELGLL